MNPTTLIRCVAATLAATTLLLAQSAPLPSAPRTTNKAQEPSSERMQVRLAEVIAMLEEDDLSPEQRAQAKKKLQEIVARLREAQPATPVAPVPPSPAAAPRSPQPSPRTEVVELAPPAADAPRGRVLRVTGHGEGDPVMRAPQEPANPPVPPKADKPAKTGKPKTPKPPKPDTAEGPTPFEVTEVETRKPVPQDFRRLEVERVDAARHADAMRAEAEKLRAAAERLHAEAHGQNEDLRLLRSKVDQEKRAADEARSQADQARGQLRARSLAPEAQAQREAEEANRFYTARTQARDEAVKAEKQAKANADHRRTFVFEESGEQKAAEPRTRAGQAPGRQLETRNEGGETRAVEVAPRARGHEVQGHGDDEEIRALIDQMRAEMREIRELIQQMRKQTSAAPHNAGVPGQYGVGGGKAPGTSPSSVYGRAPSGQQYEVQWVGPDNAPKAPTNMKWTTSGKVEGSGSGEAGVEGAGSSSNAPEPKRFDFRWGQNTGGGTTVPMKVDFRSWNEAK